jgi:peptide deformylase
MPLPVIKYGDPILFKKGKLVLEFSNELANLYKEMLETMYQEEGIGLAAPANRS